MVTRKIAKISIVMLCFGVQTFSSPSSEGENSTAVLNVTTGIRLADISKDVTPCPSVSSLSSSWDRDLSIALGVVPTLGLLLLCSVVGGAWYYTSYGKVLKDWEKYGRDDDPSKEDLGCTLGPDGRAVWNDYYGHYEAENAMDMINIFALCHHRVHDRSIGDRMLPLYAIKGRELESIEHGFTHLEVEHRPWFTFEVIGSKTPGFTQKKWWRLRNEESERGSAGKQITTKDKLEATKARQEKYTAGAPKESTDEDCDTNASANSGCPGCKIVPLRRVYGQTCIADKTEPKHEEDYLQESTFVKTPLSPNSRGDVTADDEKPQNAATTDGKGKLPPQGDPFSAGEAPLPTSFTILPSYVKAMEEATPNSQAVV